jgi:membrane-associated phospholipid phosphatase
MVLVLVPLTGYAQERRGDAPERIFVSDAVTASDATISVGQPAGPAPTPEHTGIKALVSDLFDDVEHLPASENIGWAAFGGASALAVHPADHHVTPYLVHASWSQGVFAFGAVIGDTPELLAASVAVYAVGRTKDYPKVSHLGMDLIQAIAVSNMIVQPLKYATGRERPDGSGDTSFPSGHASDTFAVATALERHLGWRGAVPAFTFASYVAISRMHDNRHYLSDVVFGSSVGIISGRTVTRHGRAFPVTITALPGGAAIMYARRSE